MNKPSKADVLSDFDHTETAMQIGLPAPSLTSIGHSFHDPFNSREYWMSYSEPVFWFSEFVNASKQASSPSWQPVHSSSVKTRGSGVLHPIKSARAQSDIVLIIL